MASQPTLYQFAFSHYNEKARWALEWKGLDHERRNLLPGFHEGFARKLSGATQTPILQDGDRVVAGSTAILRYLDARVSAAPLFPAAATERDAASQWIEWLDDEVGVATRLALFHEVLVEPKTAALLFTAGQPNWKARPYAWFFPKVIPKLRRAMSINDETARDANRTIEQALDRLAAATRETGYLVGDRFGAADLTAACLLFPLSFPKELRFSSAHLTSPALDGWKARWRGHQAVVWMEEIFRRHRIVQGPG